MDHHPTLAPSSFPALQVCSHYVSKPGERGEPAKRGDRIHAVTEAILRGEDEIATLVKDEQNCAEWLVQETKALLTSVEGIGVGVSIRDPLSDEEITFGTLDCWGFDDEGSPILIDWKTGMVADYRAQLMVYALGLMDMLTVDYVHCIIIYGDQRKIERLPVTRVEAEALLNNTLQRQADPDQPFVRSTYCGRCALKPECPAWVGPASSLALSNSALDISEGLELIIKDPLKLGQFIKAYKALSELVEEHDVTGAAIKLIEAGVPVGNYEVRERKGRRTYARDSVQTILHLVEDGSLDADEASAMFRLDPKEVDTFFKSKNKPVPINTFVKGTYKILVEKNGK